MHKNILLTVGLMFVIFSSHAQIPKDAIMENPYSAAMIAGTLPIQKSQLKCKTWKRISTRTKSLVPYLQQIEAYFAGGELKQILTLLKQKKELNDLLLEHPRTGMIVVKTYLKTKQPKLAMDLLVKLNEKHQTDQEIAFLTVQFYEQRKEITNALKIADNYLNKAPKKPTNVAFYFLKSRLYLNPQINDPKKALVCIEEALDLQPRFDMGWLIFAQLNEKKGQLEAAIKGYTNYLDIASTRQITNAMQHLLFKSIEAKLLQLLSMQIVKQNPNITHDQRAQYRNKIIKLFQKKEYKKALDQLERYMSQHSANDQDRLLKIQILGAMKKFEQAAHELKKWIFTEPNKALWFETLHLLYFAGLDSYTLIRILKDVEKKYPKNLLAHLYLADLITRTADFKTAIIHHNKALKLTNNPELQTSIYFQLGLLFYETKQFKNMETALKKGKALGLDYAPLLNLLAYHYSGKRNDLKQAQELMNTVLAQAPNNPHFLDTQALIFYKQGNYIKAHALLEKIVHQEPTDATILKHLAKTSYKLNRADQALAYMERAIECTHETKKKKKYQQLASQWKTDAHTKKQGTLLCSR